jgi:glycerol-3-phosphate dehydrogenase
VVGTTDTPIERASYEPLPFEQEIDFVLETAGQYLNRRPRREDVQSVYAGIRPLVKGNGRNHGKTSTLSRDHTIQIDPSGLLTIVGGKWTTYRHMAEDAVNHAIALGRLDERPCVTRNLHLHGYTSDAGGYGALEVYGTDAEQIQDLARGSAEFAQQLHPALPYIGAEVVWAARQEMARSVEDVLARRTRALFLNARAAMAMAPAVADLLAGELGRDEAWKRTEVARFNELAARYTLERVATNQTTEDK